MARYALAVDISRCNGCGSCFMACKDEYVGNDHPPISAAQPRHGQQWLRIDEIEQGEGSKVKVNYIPLMCQHCKNPPCAKGAPEGAVFTRADGVVILDPEKSAGCSEILGNCPYGVIYWNEERGIPQKCTMCAHILDNGEITTRCAESCPTKALFFGDVDDPESEISKYIAQRGGFTALKPELGTGPAVLYRELPAPFITGEAILSDRPDECLEGARAVCISEDGQERETLTDFMGDFQFKGLTQGGKYKISVSFPGYKSSESSLMLDKAKDLGVIALEKQN